MSSVPDIEPVKRTSEIEEITNKYLIHPISTRLVPVLAYFGVKPNSVSITGMASGIMAGIAYSNYQETGLTIAGFFLMIVWHVLDGADGQLARLTNSQSQSGKILDGACDYITFIAVYVGLAFALNEHDGYWVWGVVALAGACHALQSAAYEIQRQDYEFWGLGKKSAELPDPNAQLESCEVQLARRRIISDFYRAYVRVQIFVSGMSAECRCDLASVLALEPNRVPAVRLLYRRRFASKVRYWSVLSANYRTLGLFLFALAKVPLTYFFFEIIGLNIILATLLYGQRAQYATFVASLAKRE